MRTLQFSQRKKGRSAYILKRNKTFLIFFKTESIIFVSLDNISLRPFQDQSGLILTHRVRLSSSTVYSGSHEKTGSLRNQWLLDPRAGSSRRHGQALSPHEAVHHSSLAHNPFLQPASLSIKALGSRWTYWLSADPVSQSGGAKRRAGCQWQAAQRVGNLGVLGSLALKDHHYSI